MMGLCVSIFTVQQGITQYIEARAEMQGGWLSGAYSGASMDGKPPQDENVAHTRARARILPRPPIP